MEALTQHLPRSKRSRQILKDSLEVRRKDFQINLVYFFSSDNRDQNGFWVPFKVHSIRGSFKCDIDPHFWHSNDIQVDLMVTNQL